MSATAISTDVRLIVPKLPGTNDLKRPSGDFTCTMCMTTFTSSPSTDAEASFTPGITLYPCKHQCCEPCHRKWLIAQATAEKASEEDCDLAHCEQCRGAVNCWITHRDGTCEMASLTAVRLHARKSEDMTSMIKAIQHRHASEAVKAQQLAARADEEHSHWYCMYMQATSCETARAILDEAPSDATSLMVLQASRCLAALHTEEEDAEPMQLAHHPLSPGFGLSMSLLLGGMLRRPAAAAAASASASASASTEQAHSTRRATRARPSSQPNESPQRESKRTRRTAAPRQGRTGN